MARRKRTKRTAIIVQGGAKKKYFDCCSNWPNDEIWCLNGIAFKWLPRIDRMFNIHRYALLKEYGYSIDYDVSWAAINRHVPFYVADEWPGGILPNQVIFPREVLRRMPRGNYHCNSADWQIALAIYEGFERIRVHGVNLALNSVNEQLSARACFEYWVGYAEGLGIEVVMAPDCDMFYAYHLVRSERVYGYDDCPVYEDRTSSKAPHGAPYRYDDL